MGNQLKVCGIGLGNKPWLCNTSQGTGRVGAKGVSGKADTLQTALHMGFKCSFVFYFLRSIVDTEIIFPLEMIRST